MYEKLSFGRYDFQPVSVGILDEVDAHLGVFEADAAHFLVLGISLVLGACSSLGYSAWGMVKILGLQFLDFFDFISNSVLMPIVALCTAIFVGFFLKPKAVIDEVELSGKFKLKGLFSVMIRYVAPVCILAILISSVLSAFGIISI